MSGVATAPTASDRARLPWTVLVGWTSVVFSLVYLLSDVIETAQGDFSTVRLCLTYAGEAAIPLFVIGLYAAARHRLGLMGLIGAAAYAYSYIFFTGTVLFALVDHTRSYHSLAQTFGPAMVIHGAIMLIGGLAFGFAVVRSGTFPRWTGLVLMVGVILVVSASDLSNIARTVAAAFPAIAFVGMGVSLLTGNRSEVHSA
jgi:hypothetical protein